MSKQINEQAVIYERTLIDIVRHLSPQRLSQLVDFARFLEAQTLEEELATEEDSGALIEEENAEWDALLATEESQALLEKLADEALAEHRAGRSQKLVFTQEGRVAPE